MSVKYVPVQWTKRKIVYDVILVVGVLVYLNVYRFITAASHTGAEALSDAIVQFRSYGSCAFLMLTFILCIGPLARLDRRFLPLLYNRRHFGVIMFGVVAFHAYQVLGYYHAFSDVPRLVAFLRYDSEITTASIPFQLFGALALLILFVMCVTSHDFWQKTLGPMTWKGLHMFVYLAYALVVIHVAFGALQYEANPVFNGLFVTSVGIVIGLHLLAARKSAGVDREPVRWVEYEGKKYIDAGHPEDIVEDRARAVVGPDGERIAVIRYAGKISALHGHCAHQGGPLYEGKVVDGCLTCPWHGWQYRPEDGQSPPPFTERLPTYRLCFGEDRRILVDPTPLPPGTAVSPLRLDDDGSGS